ncbi:MAG: SUMF1/EgtB/PvdO family nonheme iron enzyme [Gammaproteobacteria bacterium]|nr:SUMF1/EgtB/PvdO family nonheme iron enzyme [Gammaproteobacteria bacterium]
MPEISTFISASWLKPLGKKLPALRKKRNEEIGRIADLFGDPELLAKYYIPPNCRRYNPADSDDRENGRSDSPAFELINNFFNGELLEQDGRTQMFILSDAGMGKTSLLMMLKLAHLTAFWPPDYQCVLLKLGEENTIDRIKAVENRNKTVLLLDALEEDPTAWGRTRKRLLELLEETKLFHRVFISCLTQFFPEKRLKPFGGTGRMVLEDFRCPMLFLSPFNDQQLDEYLERKFPIRLSHSVPQHNKAEKERLRACAILNKMGSPGLCPMLLVHIDDLLEAGDLQQNAYKIYSALVDVWLQREQRKLRRLYDENTKKVPDNKTLLKVCVQVAAFMQAHGKQKIEESELNLLIAADPSINWLLEFDVGGRSLLKRDSQRAFHFSHYTIQEFLLAHGLVNHNLALDEPLRATDEIMKFLKLADPAETWMNLLDFKRVQLGKYLRANPRLYRDFQNADFAGVNLSGAYLEGANLRGADLKGANLSNARLVDANLAETKFAEADLTDAIGLIFRDKFREEGEGPEMLVLSGGMLKMGDTQAIEGIGENDEKPVHEVTLDAFSIGRYPVTFDDYDKFCAATGREKPGDEGWGRSWRPVINVLWEDATAYCKWLSERIGANYRLPTEAEWEYACRAGSETAYFFGEDANQLSYHAWHAGNAEGKTHPVGEKRANAWGLYELSGNVWEWVHDWYAGYSEEAQTNPEGSESGAFRVIRGGSWYYSLRRVRSTSRSRRAPGYCFDYLGFRLARTHPLSSYPFTLSTQAMIHERLKDGTEAPVMVYLPGRTFKMGDTQGISRDNEKTVHKVTLDAFAIGRYPVTFDDYDNFCTATKRKKPGDEGWGRSQRPVINVSWEDAAAYCEWLSEQTGAKYRLPTEAEWEYACRAGSETAYYFGNDGQGEYAWYSENSKGKTHPVGEKSANAWGLYELSGNVWEWVYDWYAGYSGEDQVNPRGPESGSDRVIRGGCWFSDIGNCRSAYRDFWGGPVDRSCYVSFRLVRTYP